MAKIIKATIKVPAASKATITKKSDDLRDDTYERSLFYSIRIELLDGFVLHYPISYDTQTWLSTFLINLYEPDKDNKPVKYFSFETTPNRLVLINLDQITGLAILNDFEDTLGVYGDHFECLVDDEKVTDEKLILPDAVIKLAHPFLDQKIKTYYSLNKEQMTFMPELLQEGIDVPYFLYLVDDDGDDNYIPMHNIQCAEFDNALFSLEED
jgi:hypothetical protein